MRIAKAFSGILVGVIAWVGMIGQAQAQCGGLVGGSTPGPGQASTHGFQASEGEQIGLYLYSQSDFPIANVWYENSNHQKVYFANGCSVVSNVPFNFCEFRIPSGTGTASYNVDVVNNTQAVSYQLEILHTLPQFACAEELPCGTRVATDIDLPGRRRFFRFSSEANEEVTFHAFAASGEPGFAPLIYLRDEAGGMVPSNGGTLAEGSYLIQISAWQTGVAEVALQRLTPSLSCGPAICPGEVASGRLDYQFEHAVFIWSGSAGDQIVIRTYGANGGAGPTASVRRPDGRLLSGNQLIESGLHLIDVSSTYLTGDFELTLENLNGPSQCLRERLSIYDPVFPRALSKVDYGGELSPYLDDYEDEGAERIGAVADGVTKLVLKYRTDSANPVTFQLPWAGGYLRKIGGAARSGSQVVTPVVGSDGEYYAYAIYEAPDMPAAGLGSLLSRPVTLTINHDLGLTDSRSIELQRPSVVLVHGLWDDKTGWDWFDPRLQAKGWVTERAEFPSAVSFDPRLPMPLNRPVTSLFQTIVRDTLPKLRSEGIAATQVYVVAHSMGGLVTRSLSQQPLYRRADNYGEGDIYGLLTMGTPHLGSQLADLVFSNPCLLVGPNGFRPVIGLGDTLSGAAADMRTLSGAIAALNAPPEFELGVHTIVGIAPPLGELAWKKVWSNIFRWLSNIEECGLDFDAYEPLADPRILYGGRSDLVVSETSQMAGRAPSLAVSIISNIVHNGLTSYLSLVPQERESQSVLDTTALMLSAGNSARFSHVR